MSHPTRNIVLDGCCIGSNYHLQDWASISSVSALKGEGMDIAFAASMLPLEDVIWMGTDAADLTPWAEQASEGTLEAALRAAAPEPAAGIDNVLLLAPPVDDAIFFILELSEPEQQETRNDDLAFMGSMIGAPQETSWLAWTFDADDRASAVASSVLTRGALAGMSPIFSAYDDVDGDGEEDGPIVVTGSGNEEDNKIGQDEKGGGGGEMGGGGGSSNPPAEEPLDCRDRKALSAQSDIRAENDWQQKEHGVIIYRDPSGSVQRSTVIQGDDLSIPRAAIEQWLTANGVEMSQVIGFVHNHPLWQYACAVDANRYPSGGRVPGGDWNVADWFVSGGAGGPGGSNFALYVMDTGGQLREFSYTGRDFYKNLSFEDRERGVGLPDRMQSDGTTC